VGSTSRQQGREGAGWYVGYNQVIIFLFSIEKTPSIEKKKCIFDIKSVL
jgi:hypothetical protein